MSLAGYLGPRLGGPEPLHLRPGAAGGDAGARGHERKTSKYKIPVRSVLIISIC